MKFQKDFSDGVESYNKGEEIRPIEFAFDNEYLSGIRILVKLLDRDKIVDVDLGLAVDYEETRLLLKKPRDKQEEYLRNMILGNKYGI